ncbi:MAG: MBL fold metallo-hydrolase [Candidatus Hydrothermales bacterium]
MSKVIFLGTGGGRVVVFQGLRSSGGLLISNKDFLIHIDPGPGALSALLKNGIYPNKIDCIWITHKDLDHTGELNIIVEGMTEGGLKKRGTLYTPEEVLKEHVLLDYLRDYLNEIVVIKNESVYHIKDYRFITSPPHNHRGVECYGFIIENYSFGYLVDTRPEEKILNFYRGLNYLVVNCVLLEPKEDVYHISLKDVPYIYEIAKPKKLILNHFGMRLLKYGYKNISDYLNKFNIPFLIAYDNMKIEL